MGNIKKRLFGGKMKSFKILLVLAILVSITITAYAVKSKDAIALEIELGADSLYNAKQYDTAIVEYEKSLATFKEAVTDTNKFEKDINVLYDKLYKSGYFGKKFDVAVKYGELILVSTPNDSTLVNNISVFYRSNLNNLAKSIEVWKNYEAKHPTLYARNNIASIYEKANDYKNAIIWYQKAYELSKDASILAEIADMYYKDGQLAMSAKNYEQYLISNPSQEELLKTYKNLGAMYQKLKNSAKSASYFEKYINITFDAKMSVYVASVCLDQKNYPKAIKYASMVLEKTPNHADALYIRALSYYNSNKKPLAKADFTKIQKDPKYGQNAKTYLQMIASGK